MTKIITKMAKVTNMQSSHGNLSAGALRITKKDENGGSHVSKAMRLLKGVVLFGDYSCIAQQILKTRLNLGKISLLSGPVALPSPLPPSTGYLSQSLMLHYALLGIANYRYTLALCQQKRRPHGPSTALQRSRVMAF